MPKQVDHQARREHIADAVCRLAAVEGLDGVSLRRVAAEAGVSMGQVQHYFTTKDEMLVFAFTTVGARVEQRLGAAAEQSQSTRDLLRTFLVAMISADAEGQVEAPLWVAFLARAAVRPELAEPLKGGAQAMNQFAVDQLRSAQRTGEVDPELDVEREASSLLALADGLMIRCLLDPGRVVDALATVDYQLDRIFTDDRT